MIGLREETLCVVSNKFMLDCLRIGAMQQLQTQYNPSCVISSRAINTVRQIVKFMLQRYAALTMVCFRKFFNSSDAESLIRYTSFGVLFQCDNDRLFYWLPSDMTSVYNIDFN